MIFDDPLCCYLDVIGVNEYIGWYSGKPEDALKKQWESNLYKPLIISEFGAGALYDFMVIRYKMDRRIPGKCL